ncbi:uncharacterized protein LOC133187200 [Saccostrea echinata]|uniref:uncharacterized protein LOC133187200 n=1 Tax=Saccostrea echinata TaxID=191078 RepID=UPI002A8336F1|nr:uncharacterized protein LOC133187200 [Saccostrea echinata]
MADSLKDEESSKPGIGMRLTIASISKRFPRARNISTQWLFKRLYNSQESQSSQESQNSQGSHTFQETQSSASRVKILDCRAEDEYNISHIDGAVRVNYESSPEEILHAADIDKSTNDLLDVVCYCSVGYRSALVAQKLQDYVNKSMGNDHLSFYNMEGSLFKWANENRHMVDQKGDATKFAHPYNAVFGKLLNSELRKS